MRDPKLYSEGTNYIIGSPNTKNLLNKESD